MEAFHLDYVEKRDSIVEILLEPFPNSIYTTDSVTVVSVSYLSY